MTEIITDKLPGGAGEPQPPTKQETAGLLDGLLRREAALTPTRRAIRRRERLAQAEAEAKYLQDQAVGAGKVARKARQTLEQTPEIVSHLNGAVAALITVVLMAASFLTIHTVLAASDAGLVESWTLPGGFGPVFVLMAKTLTTAWLNRQDDQKRDPAARRVLGWWAVPLLPIAVAALLGGVAIKATLLDSGDVLSDPVLALSSALIFSCLLLAELVCACGLAVLQHAPGAHTYLRRRKEFRKANKTFQKRSAKAAKKTRRVAGLRAANHAHQERDYGRASSATVFGRMKANEADGDAISRGTVIDPLTYDAPATHASPGFTRFPEPVSEEAFEEELRKLLRDDDPRGDDPRGDDPRGDGPRGDQAPA